MMHANTNIIKITFASQRFSTFFSTLSTQIIYSLFALNFFLKNRICMWNGVIATGFVTPEMNL